MTTATVPVPVAELTAVATRTVDPQTTSDKLRLGHVERQRTPGPEQLVKTVLTRIELALGFQRPQHPRWERHVAIELDSERDLVCRNVGSGISWMRDLDRLAPDLPKRRHAGERNAPAGGRVQGKNATPTITRMGSIRVSDVHARELVQQFLHAREHIVLSLDVHGDVRCAFGLP